MDPEILTNGTNRAKVLRFETSIDTSIFNNHMVRTDPFNEKKDMQDSDNLEIFRRMMVDTCEGNAFSNHIFMPSYFV